MWGNQNIRRDHIYIKDVVSALRCAAHSGESRGICTVASGVGYSQYEEALALAQVFAPSQDIHSEVICKPEKPGLTRGYVYDISLAKELLNWEPQYTDLITMYTDYRKEWESKKFHNYHIIRKDQQPATL